MVNVGLFNKITVDKFRLSLLYVGNHLYQTHLLDQDTDQAPDNESMPPEKILATALAGDPQAAYVADQNQGKTLQMMAVHQLHHLSAGQSRLERWAATGDNSGQLSREIVQYCETYFYINRKN